MQKIMPAAAIPKNEIERLNALIELAVLDSAPEPEFDAIVEAAALVCGVTISLISLIDTERQWFKANVGLPGATETPRDMAFCAHAIHEEGILEVEDATLDPRFCDNPLVTSKPNIRFYAGATLRLRTGEHLGTLCVIDNKPHKLSLHQRAVLAKLAIAVVKALEGRHALERQRRLITLSTEAIKNLAESDIRFRKLSENSSIGIYETDAAGACIYTNAAWQNIYGLTPEESMGDGWTQTLHPDDRAAVFSEWQRTASDRSEFSMSFRIRQTSSEIKYVHSRANSVVNPENIITGFIGSVEDVTTQALARHETETLLSTISSQFIVSITDKHGAIIEVNDSFCAISQYSREELLGRNHRIVNSGEHPQEFFEVMWKTISSGVPWRGDICNRAKDGSLFWVNSVITPLVNSRGEADRYMAIRSDITQRKLQEEALRKSQFLLNQTGALAGVGGWEVDLQKNTIYWSEETCRIHGVPAHYQPTLEEAIHFYAPEAQPIIRSAVNNSIATGEGWDLELPFIQTNGTRIWVRAVGQIEFEAGKPTRLLGAFQNIDERVKQVQELHSIKDRISLATDSGEIGVWEYNVISGEMIWDEWMYRLYGELPNESKSSYSLWASHLHPEDLANAEAAISDAINGIRDFATEFRIILKSGAIRNIRGTARVIRNEQGTAIKLIGVNWDVTSLHALSTQLAEQHELLRVTLQSIGDAVITTDPQGSITWLNPVAERMTGWSAQEACGRPLLQVFHIINQDTRLTTESPVETCLAQGKMVGLANHTLLISRNGDEFGIEDSAAPIRNEKGEMLGAVLVFHNVTEQRRLSGEISYQATHDALTGLVNRTEFDVRLRRLLHSMRDDQSQHAFMYIDLDQFKIVNDSCGHSGGDRLLQQVSKLLSETIRSRDTLARLGGDEFGVILEKCTTEQALRVAQEICDKMEIFRFIHDDKRFRIGTSIGLVPVDSRWPNTAELMQAADTSCYVAKETGRNRVHMWLDTDMALRTRHGEMQWATRIEQTLDENRFELFAQRITPLNGDLNKIHAEVLLRMRDSDGSLIQPGTFLPAAERFHLASRIDRWVLQKSIQWLTNTPHTAQLEMLSINLSGQSVGDRAFHRQAIEMLKESGPEVCKLICIEITETAAVTNLTDASLFIEQLCELGVSVALDDFGAGASSFGYLKQLKVNILKIDGQFIKNLLTDPLDDVAVRCFIDVAKVMKIKTVAEYVDNPDVLARIHELGVDYAQGFLLHKPEPISQAIKK